MLSHERRGPDGPRARISNAEDVAAESSRLEAAIGIHKFQGSLAAPRTAAAAHHAETVVLVAQVEPAQLAGKSLAHYLVAEI